jgi:hypothetical protein
VWPDAGSNSTIIWFLLFIAATNFNYTKIWFVRITKWISVFVIHQAKMFWRARFIQTRTSCFVSSLLLSFYHCFILFLSFDSFLSMSCFLRRGRISITLPSNSGSLGYKFQPDHRLSWLSYFVAFQSLQANGGAGPQNGPFPFPFISFHLILRSQFYYSLL